MKNKKAASAKIPTIKKDTAAKKEKATLQWSTMHVFGYGETQIIGADVNGKLASTELKAIEPLLVSLAGKQQKGTKIKPDNIHSLNIFNNSFVDYRPKPGSNSEPQRFAWSDVDTKAVEKLATELTGKLPELNPREPRTPGRHMQLIMDMRKKMKEARGEAEKPATKKAAKAAPKAAVKKVATKTAKKSSAKAK